MEPGLEATAVYDPPNFSWPGGAHAAVVEVDTETGDARLVRYVAVDDVGTVVNPLIVDGQVHGGITQGIAAALYEEGVYDEDGNLQTANLVTYLVPSAAELPSFELDRTETPSPTNPLGREGRGGDRHDRRGACRDQRGGRRPLAPRRQGHPDAGHARACLARDRGGEAVIPAAFDYDVAESVEHAVELLGEGGGDAKLLAGGHSLIPALKLRIARPSKLVDLGRLTDLAYVRDGGTHVAIGALTRHAPSPPTRSSRALPDRLVHGRADRRPAGAPPRHDRRHAGARRPGLGHARGDARARRGARRAGPGGERAIPATEFFTGVFETALAPDEVLVEIRVPKLGASTGWAYIKANRRAQDWATVGVAALVHRDNGKVAGASIGLVNMGATPLRAKAAEEALAGGASVADAAALVRDGAEPPSDSRGRRSTARICAR